MPRPSPSRKARGAGSNQYQQKPGGSSRSRRDRSTVTAVDRSGLRSRFAQLLPAAVRRKASTQTGSFDTCKHTSAQVVRKAQQAGFDARWVQLAGAPAWPAYQDCDRRWDRIPERDLWVHYVAKIDGVYVDFSARQFDPTADVPTVSTRHGWDREYDITDAVDEFLEGPAPGSRTRGR